jgi:hypothetical protein
MPMDQRIAREIPWKKKGGRVWKSHARDEHDGQWKQWLSVELGTLSLHGRRASPTCHGSFFRSYASLLSELSTYVGRGWLGSNERLPLSIARDKPCFFHDK